MKLFCANCGIKLRIIRKAVPKLGVIIDLVETHTCLETPVDSTSVIVEDPISAADQKKFVESLNGLKSTRDQGMGRIHKENYGEGKSLRPSSMTGTDDLRDRRFEKDELKSTAPSSILDQIKHMSNSIPANDLKDDPTDSEMGG